MWAATTRREPTVRLDGKPVEIVSHRATRYRSLLLGPVNQRKRFFSPSWSQRIVECVRAGTSPENWYFICDGNLHGHGYLVGYDKMAKAKVGYIGRNGFRSDEPPREEQFPVDGQRISMRGIDSVILYGFDSRKPNMQIPPDRRWFGADRFEEANGEGRAEGDQSDFGRGIA